MKRAIFISYRRDDAEGEAGRLYDDLVRAYGDDSVFMDVAGIAPGLDFRKAIDDSVSGCGVFLAVIGSQWATITGTDGQRRIEDANDFVRLEIASALNRNIAVIPVLVHEARMPRPDQLPDNIKDLAYRNSVEISHTRWNSDTQLLVNALQQYVQTTRATQTEPVHATVPVQLPPPVTPHPDSARKASKMPLILGGSAVLLVLLAAIGYFTMRPQANGTPTQAAVSTQTTPQTASRTPSQTAPAGQAITLAGDWRNQQPRSATDALIELRITGSGTAYNVEPIGQCPQGECSWGVRTVYLQNGQAVGDWAPRNTPEDVNKQRSVRLALRPDGRLLAVQVLNTWFGNQPSRTQSNQFSYIFERVQ